jgi:hypothetical protein
MMLTGILAEGGYAGLKAGELPFFLCSVKEIKSPVSGVWIGPSRLNTVKRGMVMNKTEPVWIQIITSCSKDRRVRTED